MIVDSLKNAWKVADLRNKILFTLLMFLVFRIGAHIPVPFIDRQQLLNLIGEGTLVSFFDTISGGAFKSFSVFAMSIAPYINASIIMQLMQVIFPKLHELAKEGDEGRKKITQYIRYGTVVLGFIQAFGLSVGLLQPALSISNPSYKWPIIFMISLVLTAGTAFLMWLGELITERGIGNGISLIIFAGIVSRVPDGLKFILQSVKAGEASWFSLILLVLIVVAVIAAIVYIQEGQRRIPVQYAKRVVGRKVYGGQSTHIPMKVLQAGVIPVIFAISLLAFPQQIATWFPGSGFANFINVWFSPNGRWTSIPYETMYAALIIAFTYFYTGITFNPLDVADNIKKYGGFIPGLRPGRPTAEYIGKVLSRITMAGAIFLALIAVLPQIVIGLTGFKNIYFGGTSLLIVVGVALDSMKQLESHLLMRHYQGFMK
ncbi:MAG TPA: preprotein translocase subunit SecY [Verrucomicrobiae bacterium]|nr:preprotein translocase subunit SecY [Verrucomicrobiae bacterium]